MGLTTRSFSTIVLVLALAGCVGKSDPSHVGMSGTVTLNGEPLADAQVTFIPTGDTQGIGAGAWTEADGRYQLIDRRGKPGTQPGTYKVTISKRLMPNGSEVPVDDKKPPIESPARESLPPNYSDSVKTELQAIVPEQGGTVDFPLKVRVK
jgi:hypothetical protein